MRSLEYEWPNNPNIIKISAEKQMFVHDFIVVGTNMKWEYF